MSTSQTHILLPKKFVPALAALAEARIYMPQAVIARQGELEWSLFYIRRGRVGVIRHDEDGTAHRTATLSEGGFFGEVGLIFDTPRTADVVTDEECDVLVLERRKAHELLQREPELHAFLKQSGLTRWAHTVLLTSPLLRNIADDRRAELVGRASVRVAPAGTTLFHEAHADGILWVLISGTADKQVGPERWEEIEAVNPLNGEAATHLEGGRCSAVTECIVVGMDAEAVRRARAESR